MMTLWALGKYTTYNVLNMCDYLPISTSVFRLWQNLPLSDREHLVKVATASRSHSILELMMDECILVKFKSMLIDSDSTEKLALVDTDLHLDICFWHFGQFSVSEVPIRGGRLLVTGNTAHFYAHLILIILVICWYWLYWCWSCLCWSVYQRRLWVAAAPPPPPPPPAPPPAPAPPPPPAQCRHLPPPPAVHASAHMQSFFYVHQRQPPECALLNVHKKCYHMLSPKLNKMVKWDVC